MDATQLEHHLHKTIRAFRRLGFVFLFGGGLMFIGFLFTLFDPAGTVSVNGIETSDFRTKLGCAAFIFIFPLIGSVLAFLPQKKLDPLFRHIFQKAVDFQKGKK